MFACARRSWRDPAGGSPVRVGGSARPVASVAGSSATAAAKRTQRDDEDCIELRKRQSRGGRGAANRRRQHVRDRSARAPPESSSSRQGSCRNLGGLLSPAAALAVPGRIGKLERATPVRKTGEVGRPHSTGEASNNANRQAGGGECGGKAAGRRKGKGQRMPRTQSRNPHVPDGLRPRTGTGWAAQAPNAGRV